MKSFPVEKLFIPFHLIDQVKPELFRLVFDHQEFSLSIRVSGNSHLRVTAGESDKTNEIYDLHLIIYCNF